MYKQNQTITQLIYEGLVNMPSIKDQKLSSALVTLQTCLASQATTSALNRLKADGIEMISNQPTVLWNTYYRLSGNIMQKLKEVIENATVPDLYLLLETMSNVSIKQQTTTPNLMVQLELPI